MKRDLLGRKIPKKQIKRDVLAENKAKGKLAENMYVISATLSGAEVERSPHGRDFIERRRNLFTGKVVKTTHVEVKSSDTAQLSPLQKKTKKRTSNYRVVRQRGLF